MAVNVTEYSVPELKFTELTIERNLPFDCRDRWDTSRPNPDLLVERGGRILHSIYNKRNDETALLFDLDDKLVLADFSKNKISISIASSNKESAENYIEELKTLYEPIPDSLEGKIKVNFWYNTTHGPVSVMRTIGVPMWEQISVNYEQKTLKNLQYLVNDFKPSVGGQLLIMHGPPGTGKSFSLRSLLYSWRDWCSAEYILDPENLFGSSQGYMAELVMRDSEEEDEEGEDDKDKKWKLLILEDNGELLQLDAKDRVGQGLSRLLNLVDGLIGQGLRVLVLITTNEELSKLHPAVSREGRCAAAVKFNPFAWEDAYMWLGNKATLPDKRDFTLAELFALTKEHQRNEYEAIDLKTIGFQMR